MPGFPICGARAIVQERGMDRARRFFGFTVRWKRPATRNRLRPELVGLATLAVLAGPVPRAFPQPPAVTVFAAASTSDAMKAVVALYRRRGGGRVRLALAASSTLARQIERGAPSDIYVSADMDWMDYLETRGLLVANTRVDLFGNGLVLIAPADAAKGRIRLRRGVDLAARLGDGRLAMGDPSNVPAGRYGKQALKALGIWKSLAKRIAPAADVRSALVLVERGETPLGIVYRSDVVADDGVSVLGVFPADSHSPIVYPAAIIAGHDRANVRAFFTFLRAADARRIFEKHGFSSLR